MQMLFENVADIFPVSFKIHEGVFIAHLQRAQGELLGLPGVRRASSTSSPSKMLGQYGPNLAGMFLWRSSLKIVHRI